VGPRFLKADLKNEPIYIYGDGLQTRSFCYVDDNVETCVKVMFENKCVNDVLNVGSDLEQTILSLAQNIIKIAKSNSEIIHLPPLQEGDMTRRCPDTSKMKAILGRPLITLEEGITNLIQLECE